MPKRYPSEFRRRVLDLIAAGRSVASVAEDLGVSAQTIYTWRRQDAIDPGQAGLSSLEQDELRAAAGGSHNRRTNWRSSEGLAEPGCRRK